MAKFKAQLSKHARARVTGRMHDIVGQNEVLEAVRKQQGPLVRSQESNVHVIVKVLDRVHYREGSSGDVVIAAVTWDGFIKTVMLRHLNQCRAQRQMK